MLKIVLIDDEIIVLRGIAALLKKEADFELAGTADNGLDGMKVSLETKPNIIMTDIRMPGISGLELIRQIQKQLPDTVYIVFSGFNEFTYVKEAIGLGVIDYIEKPVTVPKLREVLKKAAGILNYQANYQEMTRNLKKADRVILEKSLRDFYERPEKELLEKIREENPKLSGCYSLCVLKVAEEHGKSVDDYREIVRKLTFDMVEREPVKVYSFYEKENLMLVYFNLGGLEFPFLEKIRAQKRKLDREEGLVMAGVSRVHRNFSELKKAFEEADLAFRYARYLGETEVISSEEVEFVGPAKERERPAYESVTFLFRTGQYEECLSGAAAYLKELKNREFLPELLIQYCWEFLHFMQIMLNEMESGGGDYLQINFYELMELVSAEEITGWTLQKVRLILDMVKKREADGSSHTIRRVKGYIEKNYDKGLSLDELAEEVHMSKTYLSMLFKKEEGISYIKYLTKVRMEKAMEFLKEGYKAKEVCGMVGYHDYKYFSTQFKGSTGMTLENFKKSL